MEKPIIEFKCPSCGWIYDADKHPAGLVPQHRRHYAAGSPTCPGTGQNPRDVNDRRPLWKDEN
jgi:rubredoxin